MKVIGPEIFGKVEVNLSEVALEVTHDMWLPLEDGISTIHFLLTINESVESSVHRKAFEKSEINVDIQVQNTNNNNKILGTLYSDADAGYKECWIHIH